MMKKEFHDTVNVCERRNFVGEIAIFNTMGLSK